MKNRLIMKYPAGWMGAKWREALPAGNGTVGAAVYGAVNDETVLLTHDDLWHEVVTTALPDVSSKLSETRRLLLEGKPEIADKVLSNALNATGYKADIGAPLPLGDLKIKMPVGVGFSNYRRELNMETGEVLVKWQDNNVTYKRRLFVSRDSDCIVMEISCEGGELSLDATLDLHDRSDAHLCDKQDPKLPVYLTVEADERGYIRYAARNDDNTDFGAVAHISCTGGHISAKSKTLHIQGGTSALIVIKLFIKGERHKDWSDIQKELSPNKGSYEKMLIPHAEKHGKLFNRVTLDLNVKEDHELSNEELLLHAYQGEASTAMVEKMWAYGRYLLIASSREGSQPCPLQGKWCGSYRGYWTFNMANENMQMNYWQAMSGNLTEIILPVFDYMERLMDDFRENAKKLYGCRGILVSCITTPPSGLYKDIQPHILHWTGAGAWIGQHYYDYYLHTGDKAFLKERALPFLREVALFYEDFFTINEEGYYVSAPSNSPENNPGNYLRGAADKHSMETTMNATMDFALAKEVLTHLIEGSAIIEESEGVENWQTMLTRIPPYQINEDGAIKEWMHPHYTDNYHHRHQSHIYPVFPGTEVTRQSDPELFKAFEVAIRKRLDIGISSQTGWSLAHMANVYARMNEGDRALNCLNLLARACVMNNFYTTHNDWRHSGIGVDFSAAPYQIDANLGWAAAIQEMLLFSVPGSITILPALPQKWQKGSVKGLLARGGVTLSIEWDIKKKDLMVELCSTGRNQTIELSLPFNKGKQTIALKADCPVKMEYPNR